MFNQKFPKWFELARQAVKDRPSILVALNDAEFVEFLNYDMPSETKLSKDYVLKLAGKTFDGVSEDSRHYYESFQEWWKKQRALQKTEIYDKLKQNGNNTYNRELEILSRRFKGWNKTDNLKVNANVEGTVDHTVNISFKTKS